MVTLQLSHLKVRRMIKRIALFGASGHGKVIADIAKAQGYTSIVFYDDRWREMKFLYGIPVVGDVSTGIQAANAYDVAYVSIGNSETRARIQSQLKKVGPSLIHPTAVVSPSVSIGYGTVVMPNAVINADTKIGAGVIINSCAVIEHDCIIGDYSHVCPNAALAGGVSVGQHSWIGIGSSVIQLRSIGSNTIVGAGAAVVNDVTDDETVIGNPAKPLKR